jgi:hypothetical protein
VCTEDAVILIDWLIDRLNVQRVSFLTAEEQNKTNIISRSVRTDETRRLKNKVSGGEENQEIT